MFNAFLSESNNLTVQPARQNTMAQLIQLGHLQQSQQYVSQLLALAISLFSVSSSIMLLPTRYQIQHQQYQPQLRYELQLHPDVLVPHMREGDAS